MGLWKMIKSLFASGGSAPPDAPRLRAGNESELSVSLGALPDGERGWITLSEARHLFSHMDDQYAFGEMDDVGKSKLGAFAAQSEHRSSVDIMPVEGRVYFTRRIKGERHVTLIGFSEASKQRGALAPTRNKTARVRHLARVLNGGVAARGASAAAGDAKNEGEHDVREEGGRG